VPCPILIVYRLSFLSLSLFLLAVGYGFCYLPSSSGEHDLEVDIWKPVGAPLEEVTDFHLGGGPSLVDTEVIHQVNKAKEDRCHLFTQSMGTVRIHLEVTLRNFQAHKIKA
jgi:B9 domain-containing protein 2